MTEANKYFDGEGWREKTCPFDHIPEPCSCCNAIEAARLEGQRKERERIAQAIEAQREQFIRVAHADADSIIVKVYDDAIWIARSGGSDE